MSFHPILKHLENKLSIIIDNETQFNAGIIEKFKLPRNSKFTTVFGNIDWAVITPFYQTKIGELSNVKVQTILRNYTVLEKYQHIYFQIGYKGSIVKIATQDFILYWEEILFASNEGFPFITPDGTYFGEFLEVKQLMYTNFK